MDHLQYLIFEKEKALANSFCQKWHIRFYIIECSTISNAFQGEIVYLVTSDISSISICNIHGYQLLYVFGVEKHITVKLSCVTVCSL